MSQSDALFVFAEDDADATPAPERPPWHVLVVDDDSEVHSVTRLALASFRFAERPLAIHSAYSAQEAREMLAERDDFVMALVDVVMETDNAGLDLVKWIREERHDDRIRLILRTGQAGKTPQRSIIENYDINDYKEKTELTANKLFAMLYSSLRAYRDITQLERKNEALERMVAASNALFLCQTLEGFAAAVCEHSATLLRLLSADGRCEHGFVVLEDAEESRVLEACGHFDACLRHPMDDALRASTPGLQRLDALRRSVGLTFGDNWLLAVHQSEQARLLSFFECELDASANHRPLLEKWGQCVTNAFSHIRQQLRLH